MAKKSSTKKHFSETDYRERLEEAVASLSVPTDEEMTEVPSRREVIVPAYEMAVNDAVAEGADPASLRDWVVASSYDEGLTSGQEEDLKRRLPSLFGETVGETVGENTVNIYFGSGEHPELSNFAIRPFTYAIGGKVKFQSVEQAFQYAKTYFSARSRSREIDELRRSILATVDGGELRRLGRSVPEFNSGKWDASSELVMKALLKASFSANEGAARALLATGDARLTHTQDGGRWGEAFPRLLMEVRAALREELREASLHREITEGVTQKEPDVRTVSVEDTERFNVVTVGVGKHSPEEVLSMIPGDTDVVVDMRANPSRAHEAALRSAELRKSLRRMGKNPANEDTDLRESQGLPVGPLGMEYVTMGALSGKTRDMSLLENAEDIRSVNYTKLAGTAEVKEALDRIEALVKEGKRVCILGSEAVPAMGPRVLFVGQALEVGRNISVGHVSRSRGGRISIQTQEQAVIKALGNKIIVKGDYTQFRFNGDRTYSCGRGVVLGSRSADAPVQERLIRDGWNYGRSVNFIEDPHFVGKDGHVGSGIAFDNARAAAVDRADFTVIISTGKGDRSLNKTRSMVTRSGHVELVLPTRAEDLENPELVGRWAQSIRRALSRDLTYRYARRGEPDFDRDGINVFVDGSHLARVCNSYVESMVPDDDARGKVKEGFHVDDVSGYDQDKLNAFVSAVLREAFSSPGDFDFEEDKVPYTVKTVTTIGQTGVAEAATTAAQQLGLDADVVCPKGYWFTHNDETLSGKDYPDEAAFKNRWHMGLENAVTDGQLISDIERRDYLRLQREDGFGRGLSDRQILALRLAGFPNYDISTMVETSNITMTTDSGELIGMNINTPADLVEFIDRCAAEHRIETSGAVSESYIAGKLEEAARLTGELREMGVSYITENSPEYPLNLRQMKPYTVTEYRTVVKTDGEGAEYTENEPYEVRKCRPAVLFYKGSLEALGNPMTSLRGDFNSYPEAIAAGRLLANRLNEDDISAVADLDEAAPRAALLEQMEHGGHPIAFTDHALGTSDAEGRRETRGTGISDRDAENIAPEVDKQRLTDDIAHNGGVVMSENAKGVPPAEESASRAKKLATALGHTVVALDAAFQAKPMAYPVMAAYAAYGGFMLVYETMHLAKAAFNRFGDHTKASPKIKETALTPESLDEICDSAVSNWSVDDQIGRSVAGTAESIGDGPSVYDEDDVNVEVRRSEIRVLRFRNQSVYLVPEKDKAVRDALRREYGDDIRFADPKDERRLEERFNRGLVEVEGTYVDAGLGYEGTQPLREETSVSSLWYVDGNIYTLSTAPNGTVGLPSLSVRQRNIETFRALREGALAIQRDFLSDLSLDPATPMRFENADYLVVKGNRIEVRRADAVRATIALEPDGSLRLFNHAFLDDDLEEHRGHTANVFTSGGPVAPEDVKRILDELRKTVFDRSQVEQDKWAVADRGEVSEMTEQVEKGFSKLREPNIDIAVKDLGRAVAEGLLPGGGAVRREPAEIYALLDRNISSLNKVVRSLELNIAREQKKLEGLRAVDGNEAERDEVASRIDSMSERRLYLLARRKLFARCQDELAIEAAEGKTLAACTAITDTGAVVLFLDGGVTRIVLQETGLKQSELEAAKKTLAEAAEAGESYAFENDGKAAADDAVKDIREQEEGRRAADGKKASPEEIQGECSYDTFVVERDGMQYYADRELNIISSPYPKLSPMGESFGMATNDGGQKMLITRTGQPVFTDWYDGLSKASEGVCVVRKGDAFNLLDIRKGALLSKEWAPVCDVMHDGLAVIGARPSDGPDARGKFNYIRKDGTLLCDSWLDTALPFDGKKGVAVVSLNNRVITLNKFGEAASVSDTLSEGWAVIGARDIDGDAVKGKFNYINNAGQLLCDSWLDSASPFRNGTADITLGGEPLTINKEGVAVRKKEYKGRRLGPKDKDPQ